MTELKCGTGAGIAGVGCGAELRWETTWDRDTSVAIRCLDCRVVLCARCAKGHFASSQVFAEVQKRKLETTNARLVEALKRVSLCGNPDRCSHCNEIATEALESGGELPIPGPPSPPPTPNWKPVA